MRLIDCRSVYIGGPISLGGTLSGDEVAANLARFYDIEARLQTLGLAVFNPARLPKYNRTGNLSSQSDYLEQCVWMVMQADAVVALEGWEESAGTLREVLVAQATGKPCFGEDFAPLGVEVVPTIRKVLADV